MGKKTVRNVRIPVSRRLPLVRRVLLALIPMTVISLLLLDFLTSSSHNESIDQTILDGFRLFGTLALLFLLLVLPAVLVTIGVRARYKALLAQLHRANPESFVALTSTSHVLMASLKKLSSEMPKVHQLGRVPRNLAVVVNADGVHLWVARDKPVLFITIEWNEIRAISDTIITIANRDFPAIELGVDREEDVNLVMPLGLPRLWNPILERSLDSQTLAEDIAEIKKKWVST